VVAVSLVCIAFAIDFSALAYSRCFEFVGWLRGPRHDKNLTRLPQEINGFRLRSKTKTNRSQIRLPEERWQIRCRISLAWWCDDVQVHSERVWQGWWGARLSRGYIPCRDSKGISSIFQDDIWTQFDSATLSLKTEKKITCKNTILHLT
jgi:hypothetical protein